MRYGCGNGKQAMRVERFQKCTRITSKRSSKESNQIRNHRQVSCFAHTIPVVDGALQIPNALSQRHVVRIVVGLGLARQSILVVVALF